jgi:Na+/H+ antiporter NhaD/arsenite permease-like protein
MYVAIIIVFVLGYLFIAIEDKVKINKTATALLTAVLCWILLVLGRSYFFPSITDPDSFHFISEALLEHVGEISEILFFLLGAMTIVELIDAHEGFSLITNKIKIKNRIQLLWLLSFITFFLSAALDNLTTAIVMGTLLNKMVKERKDLMLFAGMIVIAANAGGAWSPIGDVTTIMLWIGGQITAINIVSQLFIPSLVTLLIPLAIMSFQLKGSLNSEEQSNEIEEDHKVTDREKIIIFSAGIAALLFVPVFKTITHLPPFMGILLGLSLIWILTEIMHRKKTGETKHGLSIVGVIQRIDTPSILFFLGILLAVASLQTSGHLIHLSQFLDANFSNNYVVSMLIGIFSSIVDNVPLVAGAMGMYPLETYPTDHIFWELLAYCAGTGGSILIIGSAAGVAIMGISKLEFIWYVKRISLLAFLGFLGGVAAFYILHEVL